MTSLLGQWKLCLLLFFLGGSAFAKEESYPATVICTDFTTTSTDTFTIDFTIDRNSIFILFKKLEDQYAISSSINAYKRKSGVTSKLGLEFTTKSGKSFKILEDKKEGIKKICLEIDTVTMEIIYFGHCDTEDNSSTAIAHKKTTPANTSTFKEPLKRVKNENTKKAQELKEEEAALLKENKRLEDLKKEKELAAKKIAGLKEKEVARQQELANIKREKEEETAKVNKANTIALKQQIADAKKEKIALSIEIKRAKNQKLQEEKKMALLKQKEELAARNAAAKKRTKLAEAIALETRKRAQEELQLRQIDKKNQKETARIALLEKERLEIISETEELKIKNLEEQERLKKLTIEREEVERAAALKNKVLQESKDNLVKMKQARKSDYREERATKKALEKQRLAIEELKKQEVKLANEQLNAVKRNHEEELEKIVFEKAKASEITRKLTEQEMIKELDRIQRERDLAEKTINVINENYEERLTGLDNLKTLMTENTNLIVGSKIEEEDVILLEGTLFFKAEQCFYTSLTDRTIIYNTMGKELLVLDNSYEEEPINGVTFYKKKTQKYQFNGNLLLLENPVKVIKPIAFKENKSYRITSQFTDKQFKELAQNLVESGHDFSKLEFHTLLGNNTIYRLAFKINDDNYSFQESQGISDIEIIENESTGTLIVRKISED